MADLLDLLIEPWRSGIALRALAEAAMVGAIGGALGFWVLTFGLAYGAESLAHGLLPGLVVAALVAVPTATGALVAAVVGAALIAAAARDERVGPDAGTAVVVTGLLGLGGLLALAPPAPVPLGALLFGDPLAVDVLDLVTAAVLLIAGALALAALHRPLTVLAFDRDSAGALGVPARATPLALAVLLAVVVVVGVQGLGNLLVLAVLVAPPVAVRRHVRTPAAALACGGAVAVAASAAGLYASYYLETAAGASIALALCLAAAVGALLPARRPAGGKPAARPARA